MLFRGEIKGGRWLNPKVQIIWYLKYLPMSLILIFISYFFLYLKLPEYLDFQPEALHQISLFAVILLALIIPYFVVYVRYKKFIYAFTETDLVIKKGVIEKIRYVIPYEKVQEVSVSRSPLEIILGLGTVHIKTAGATSLASEMMIPGLERYHDFVNELILKSKNSKKQKEDEYNERLLLRKIEGHLKEIKKLLKN